MTPTDRFEMTRSQLDAIAWKFLQSEYTGQIYADWPHRPACRCLSPPLRTDRADQRRIGLQRLTRTRNGQHRGSLAQGSSSVAEHLGTTMTVIHKTPKDWRISPNLTDYEQTRAAFRWSTAPNPCVGMGSGLCNIAYAAVDRHADGPMASRTALRRRQARPGQHRQQLDHRSGARDVPHDPRQAAQATGQRDRHARTRRGIVMRQKPFDRTHLPPSANSAAPIRPCSR
jgi:hypothetical protein